MMTRRADGAESVLDLTRHHQINRQYARAGSPQRSLPGVPVHGRVRIEMNDAQLRRGALQALEMRRSMHALELLEARLRRVVIGKVRIQSLSDQVIADGIQALRGLGVVGTHVVQLAIAMGDECSARHYGLSAADGRRNERGDLR